MQYVILRPLISIIGIICEYYGVVSNPAGPLHSLSIPDLGLTPFDLSSYARSSTLSTLQKSTSMRLTLSQFPLPCTD